MFSDKIPDGLGLSRFLLFPEQLCTGEHAVDIDLPFADLSDLFFRGHQTFGKGVPTEFDIDQPGPHHIIFVFGSGDGGMALVEVEGDTAQKGTDLEIGQLREAEALLFQDRFGDAAAGQFGQTFGQGVGDLLIFIGKAVEEHGVVIDLEDVFPQHGCGFFEIERIFAEKSRIFLREELRNILHLRFWKFPDFGGIIRFAGSFRVKKPDTIHDVFLHPSESAPFL